MTIVIHQSLCGENNKAWDLVKTSMTDIAIAKSIAFKTDLQEQTGGLHWVPAIRGFAEGQYFLIMKTFEDTSPDVRRGRKFSHVLIIHKDDLSKIDNLQLILNLLPDKINKEAIIESVIVEVSSKDFNIDFHQPFQGRFYKLIYGLLNVAEYFNTIVWVGQEDFDLAVVELWKRLTPDERQSLHFGISFHNDLVKSDYINFYCVPESIQSRFLNSDLFIIGKNDNHIPTELSEQILIGNRTAKQRIENFQKVVETESLSRAEANLVSKGINTFENIDTVIDIKKINTLSHIIAQYSQSESQGTSFKLQLVKRIALLTKSATFSEIAVLRSFKCESFKGSKKILSEAITDWIQINVFRVREDIKKCIIFFNSLREDNNPNWWDKIIDDELKKFLKDINPSKASLIYKWLIEDSSIIVKISRFIDKSIDAESSFLEKFPTKINHQLIYELKTFSLQHSWYRLYAQLLNKQFDFNRALTELLKVDQDENYFGAIEIVLKGKKPKLIIDFAIKSGNQRVIKKAGQLIRKSPKLINPDVLDLNWQNVWLESINNGNTIATGLVDPIIVVNKLFDVVVSGNPISEKLLSEISKTEFANVLSYYDRKSLWEKLSPNIRSAFLKKTSSVLLEQLSKNSDTNIPDDDILSDYIYEKGISDFLYFNSNNIKSVLPLFEKVLQLSDNNLRDYLNNYTGQINAIDATQLGKIIYNRNFYNSANIINSRARKNNNWKFALEKCHYLLSFISKATLAINGILSSVNIPSDQWWKSAEDIIVELYPNMTSMVTIWKKSGGKESELILSNTTANAWNDVLYKLRKNRFKEITMDDLLTEIKKQYIHNTEFKIIYDLRKNYIKAK